MDCPPSLPAQACARGPPTALPLHRSAGSVTGSSTARAAVRACGRAATMRVQNSSLSPQAPRTTDTANSFFRSPAASTRHSIGVRFPTRRLPALRTVEAAVSKEYVPAEWPQYKAIRQRYAGTRFEEQRQLHLPQKHKATVPDSTLRVAMNVLESKPTTTRPAPSTGSPFHCSGPSDPHQPTMPSTQHCGRRLSCLHDARFGAGPDTVLVFALKCVLNLVHCT
jgi:hypothetical protein